MSQTELAKALKNAEAAFWHPLVIGIALTSESPNQALKHAQNRGLSKEEQTWCRLLAKALRIARELGMDALSILPHNIERKDGIYMLKETIEIQKRVLETLMEEHQCVGNDFLYEDSWIEIVKNILAINRRFREEFYTDRNKYLEYVKDCLYKERDSRAILLLIGDEQLEAKKLLLDCILDPELRSLFYTEEFDSKSIADVSRVRKQEIGPFLALFAEHIDEIFCGKDKCSANLAFADYFFMYYDHCPSYNERHEIVLTAEKMIREICGRSIFSDKKLAATLYRAMVFDTIPGANSLAEIATGDIGVIRQGFGKEEKICYYAKIPDGREISINFPFLEGDDVFLIISDPENTADRFHYLAQNAKRFPVKPQLSPSSCSSPKLELKPTL